MRNRIFLITISLLLAVLTSCGSKEETVSNAVFRFDAQERAVALGDVWTAEISCSENGGSFAPYDLSSNELKISFRSSDSEVATVDRHGNVTGAGKGKCMVIAQSPAARQGDTLYVNVVSTKDEATFRNVSWDWLQLDKGASCAQASMSIFNSIQNISILKYPEDAFSTSIVYNPGDACCIVGDAAAAAGASIAINGSYFNTTTFVSTVPLCIDGTLLTQRESSEQINGILALKDGVISITEYKALSELTALRSKYDSFIGAGPLLILNGAARTVTSTTFNERHPRSMIGVTTDRTIVLVVVDGRYTGKADGMSIPELVKVAGYLELTDALNLDGGGSSTLWTANYGVLNYPSDNKTWDHAGCRKCPTAIVIR